MRASPIRLLSGLAAAAALWPALALADFVTFGNGFGSKWDDPVHGNGAVVTWGFVPDGTTVDPGILPFSTEVSGGSQISALRASYDADFGTGAFDAAIERAMATWEAAADIEFVGPVADAGLPIGSVGATDPDIRIAAFVPVAGSGFQFVGGVGFGPPGDDLNFPDALAGDVSFNLTAGFIQPVGAEDDPIVEFGNDLENLTLHELGHAAIGLDHPAQGIGEVMFVGAGCCDFINRELSPDDVAGARVVYGAPDRDDDGVIDDVDNCTFVPNADQADVNSGEDDDTSTPGIQHFGDACDVDLNDDGVVSAADFFAVLRPCLGSDVATDPACALADLDGDGLVGPADFFSRFRPAFGDAPGPGTTEP
ncbi:MAG: hypothetical protein QNK05_22855 [Myxococcota bacterium]|nr:hypothetical protein [Myxococcota bacterium]